MSHAYVITTIIKVNTSHTALQSSVESMSSIQKLDEHSPLSRATVNVKFTDALRPGEHSDHHCGDVNTGSNTEEL